MTAVLCYITAGSMESARALGQALVAERLAACVNLIPGMVSIYEWQGRVAEDEEVVVLAKTRPDLVADLTARVCALHDYDLPCVVSIPLTDGNPDFLRWIGEQTGGGPRSAPRPPDD